MPRGFQNPHVYRGLDVERKLLVEEIAHEAHADPRGLLHVQRLVKALEMHVRRKTVAQLTPMLRTFSLSLGPTVFSNGTIDSTTAAQGIPNTR